MPRIPKRVASRVELPTESYVALTPFQRHCEKWGKGCGSELCSRAQHVCLARGRVPCDVLFVGEGPGASEDSLGKPFCGPAGKVLDEIVERGLRHARAVVGKCCGARIVQETGLGFFCEKGHVTSVAIRRPLTHALTNLVGCIPVDADGDKVGPPLDDDIRACAPRLEEFVREVARPRLIVCVGSLARDWLKEGVAVVGTRRIKRRNIVDVGDVSRVHILHPSFILRMNWSQRGLSVKREAVKVKSACQEVFGERSE